MNGPTNSWSSKARTSGGPCVRGFWANHCLASRCELGSTTSRLFNHTSCISALVLVATFLAPIARAEPANLAEIQAAADQAAAAISAYAALARGETPLVVQSPADADTPFYVIEIAGTQQRLSLATIRSNKDQYRNLLQDAKFANAGIGHHDATAFSAWVLRSLPASFENSNIRFLVIREDLALRERHGSSELVLRAWQKDAERVKLIDALTGSCPQFAKLDEETRLQLAENVGSRLAMNDDFEVTDYNELLRATAFFSSTLEQVLEKRGLLTRFESPLLEARSGPLCDFHTYLDGRARNVLDGGLPIDRELQSVLEEQCTDAALWPPRGGFGDSDWTAIRYLELMHAIDRAYSLYPQLFHSAVLCFDVVTNWAQKVMRLQGRKREVIECGSAKTPAAFFDGICGQGECRSVIEELRNDSNELMSHVNPFHADQASERQEFQFFSLVKGQAAKCNRFLKANSRTIDRLIARGDMQETLKRQQARLKREQEEAVRRGQLQRCRESCSVAWRDEPDINECVNRCTYKTSSW